MVSIEQARSQENLPSSSPGWIGATILSKGQGGVEVVLNLESEN